MHTHLNICIHGAGLLETEATRQHVAQHSWGAMHMRGEKRAYAFKNIHMH